jgi:hypothetical protein
MIDRLVAAGPIARIARVGHPPFGGDDPIEITFASGSVFSVDIGFEGATDIVVREGPLIEHAYGHLRREDPGAFAAIERDWSSEDIELPWLIGATPANPHRLVMTNPYRVNVGYVFDAGGREFVLFGEADYISAGELHDPAFAELRLETGLPYSAA